MNTMPLEADTRHLIDRNLENLGWNFTGKDKNVFCEQPRTEAERRILGGKRPDYVLYSRESDCPLIIIEAKKKGERIDIALEQGISYAKELKAPLVFATDGVFCKAFHAYENKTPLLNGEELDEFIRETLALKFLSQAEVNTVSQKVQYDRRELIKIFDEANNMLRGDGLRAGIERFGEFANILFLKLISESEQIKRDNCIKTDFDFSSCSWDSIKNISPNSRIDYINNMVYEKLNLLYQTEIFTPLTIRDNSILKEIMGKLDPLTLTDVDSDVKGDAFEYFLKASTATKNDLGEYFTPRHIVKTMVRLVNPQIGEKVYDPFCGTGGFLIESFRHIHNNMPRNATTEKMLRENTIYGNEITNTARITKMNMILAGDGHSGIGMKDSLVNPIDGKEILTDKDGNKYTNGFDVVLANMPYSQKTKHGNLYDLPSANGDSICVQHCMKAISSLSENGRMALVVPEGFLFRKDLAKTREYLLNNSELQSVISLPQGVFLPYTGVKTNIIYATKINQKIPASQKRKNYWYFDVKSDGYTLDNHRRKLDSSSDLAKYEEYRKLDDEQKEDMLQVGFEIIPIDKVCKNSFVLVGSKYREKVIYNGKYTEVALSEILDYEQPTAYIVENTNYNDDYATPVLTAGQTFILGYTNENTGIFNSPLPVIIFDDFTTATKLVDFPFKVKSSAMKILKVDKNKADIRYVYYTMQGLTFDSSIHKRYWIEEYSKLQIPLPPLDLQKQIADEIEGYQNIINGARAIIENYKPIPKIPNDCKKVKISDLCNSVLGGGTPSTLNKELWNGNIPWITSADIDENNNITTRKSITKLGIENSTSKIIPQNNIIVASRVGLGKIAINDFDVAINQDLQGLMICKDKVLPSYFVFAYSLLVKEIMNRSQGTTIKGITKDELLELDLPLPSIEIQKQIVSQIKTEQALIEPSRQLIEVFTKKIQDKISEIFS